MVQVAAVEVDEVVVLVVVEVDELAIAGDVFDDVLVVDVVFVEVLVEDAVGTFGTKTTSFVVSQLRCC